MLVRCFVHQRIKSLSWVDSTRSVNRFFMARLRVKLHFSKLVALPTATLLFRGGLWSKSSLQITLALPKRARRYSNLPALLKGFMILLKPQSADLENNLSFIT